MRPKYTPVDLMFLAGRYLEDYRPVQPNILRGCLIMVTCGNPPILVCQISLN